MRRALLSVAATALFTACQASSDVPIIDSNGVVTPTETSTPAPPTPPVTPGPLTKAEVDDLAMRMTEALEQARTGHATVAMGAISLDGDFRYLGAAPEARSEMSATMGGFGPYTFHVIAFADRVYLSLDGLMPAGKYFKSESSDPVAGSASSQLVKLDPNVLPTTLRDAASKLRLVGVEDLYGEPVVHYRSQTSLAAVAELLGDDAAAASGVVAYDLWLDPDALVRKVELKVGKTYFTAEYSDWGKQVRIREPRPRDLVASPLG
ncbi:MAG TPA: hypothetical protein VLI04_13935 [Nocardioidaceae bacterium]|nr:hypothetical protein [Nocardioidaceae bacterium]